MRTLLIVDDNDSVLCTLAMIIGQRNFRVLTALSGARALELVESERIDAALVDVHMPGMDGFQTCFALLAYARQNHRGLTVWLMTGAFSREAEKRAMEAGAVALLGKPFDIVGFLSAMEKRLAERTVQSNAASAEPSAFVPRPTP